MKKAIIIVHFIFIASICFTSDFDISFDFELGYLPIYREWESDSNNNYLSQERVDVKFAINTLFYDAIFIRGGVDIPCGIDTIANYRPYYLNSVFETGAMFSIYEIGIEHYCSHPVSISRNNKFQPKNNTAYIRTFVRVRFD